MPKTSCEFIRPWIMSHNLYDVLRSPANTFLQKRNPKCAIKSLTKLLNLATSARNQEKTLRDLPKTSELLSNHLLQTVKWTNYVFRAKKSFIKIAFLELSNSNYLIKRKEVKLKRQSSKNLNHSSFFSFVKWLPLLMWQFSNIWTKPVELMLPEITRINGLAWLRTLRMKRIKSWEERFWMDHLLQKQSLKQNKSNFILQLDVKR